MKLTEIMDRDPLDLDGFICVPKGSLWQRDIHNVWVFDTIENAQKASHSQAAMRAMDRRGGSDYMVSIETLNGIVLLLQVSDKGFHDIKFHDIEEAKDFVVYAFSVTEQSCSTAAIKAMLKHGMDPSALPVWCYKTWNSDRDYFNQDEE